jgi:hypothetical protein
MPPTRQDLWRIVRKQDEKRIGLKQSHRFIDAHELMLWISTLGSGIPANTEYQDGYSVALSAVHDQLQTMVRNNPVRMQQPAPSDQPDSSPHT